AQDPPHFFVDNWEKQAEAKPFLKNDYSVRRLPLRAWWVPDPLKGSLINFVRYYFLHEPYSPMGHTDLALYIRKDILPIWESLLQHEL
ncbi:MAG: hypothetical protein KDD48_05000, partial [Bdellovibrionales bacterium]|nr:hypothetical protein [Bdellovibrionales bacterium]